MSAQPERQGLRVRQSRGVRRLPRGSGARWRASPRRPAGVGPPRWPVRCLSVRSGSSECLRRESRAAARAEGGAEQRGSVSRPVPFGQAPPRRGRAPGTARAGSSRGHPAGMDGELADVVQLALRAPGGTSHQASPGDDREDRSPAVRSHPLAWRPTARRGRLGHAPVHAGSGTRASSSACPSLARCTATGAGGAGERASLWPAWRAIRIGVPCGHDQHRRNVRLRGPRADCARLRTGPRGSSRIAHARRELRPRPADQAVRLVVETADSRIRSHACGRTRRRPLGVEPQLRVDRLDDDEPLVVDPEPVPSGRTA